MPFLERLCITAAKRELEPQNTSSSFFYTVTFLQPIFIYLVCFLLPGDSTGSITSNSYHTIALLCYLPHWLGYVYSEISGSDKWFDVLVLLYYTENESLSFFFFIRLAYGHACSKCVLFPPIQVWRHRGYWIFLFVHICVPKDGFCNLLAPHHLDHGICLVYAAASVPCVAHCKNGQGLAFWQAHHREVV